MNIKIGDIITEHGLAATYTCKVLAVSSKYVLVRAMSATRNGAPFQALGIAQAWYIPIEDIHVVNGEYHREIDLPTFREREDI